MCLGDLAGEPMVRLQRDVNSDTQDGIGQAFAAQGITPEIMLEASSDASMLSLVDLPDTGLPEARKPETKKRGRKALPADLPRQRVEYDLADDQKVCPCCSERMHRMGEVVTEQLHIEVKATVLQNARAKYDRLRKAVCRLDGPDTQGSFNCRQGQAWGHNESR